MTIIIILFAVLILFCVSLVMRWSCIRMKRQLDMSNRKCSSSIDVIVPSILLQIYSKTGINSRQANHRITNLQLLLPFPPRPLFAGGAPAPLHDLTSTLPLKLFAWNNIWPAFPPLPYNEWGTHARREKAQLNRGEIFTNYIVETTKKSKIYSWF